ALADASAAAGAQAVDTDAYLESGALRLTTGDAEVRGGDRLEADLDERGLKVCGSLTARNCVTAAITVTGTDPNAPNTVTVTLRRSVQFGVFSVLGLKDMEISASSSASPQAG
ncbi:MAG: hypothetical protein ACOYN3_09285, partial [Acidimicrobiia bacterium]